MGFYRETVLPRVLDQMLGTEAFESLRRQILSQAKGRVLELGLGTGLSLKHYQGVDKHIYGIDPSLGARPMARQRADAQGLTLEYLSFSSDRTLAVQPESIDTLVSCFTLCTLDHILEDLNSIKAYLKPDARFLFLEHGLSSDPGVVKWQERLNGFQQWVFAGCRLNRNIPNLITQAGYSITEQQSFYVPGPKFASFVFMGSAMPSRR